MSITLNKKELEVLLNNLIKIKDDTNKYIYFKKLLDEYIQSVVAKRGMDYDYLVKHDSDLLNPFIPEAIEDINLDYELTIPMRFNWDELHATIPDPSLYLTSVTTADELIESTIKYIEDFPKIISFGLDNVQYLDFKTFDKYFDLPLNETIAFIEKYHDLFPPHNGNEYILSPYNLNYELKISFSTFEDANKYAELLSPSILWFWDEHVIKELKTY